MSQQREDRFITRAIASLLRPLEPDSEDEDDADDATNHENRTPRLADGIYAWMMARADLRRQVQTALYHIADSWLRTAPADDVRGIFFEYGSINDILPMAVINHSLGFLAAKGAAKRKVIVWPVGNVLINALCTCVAWRNCAWLLRYGLVSRRGDWVLHMHAVFEIDRETMRNSLPLWCRRTGVTRLHLKGNLEGKLMILDALENTAEHVRITSLTCDDEAIWKAIHFNARVWRDLVRVSSDMFELSDDTAAHVLHRCCVDGIRLCVWDVAVWFRNAKHVSLFNTLPKMMPAELQCVLLPRSANMCLVSDCCCCYCCCCSDPRRRSG